MATLTKIGLDAIKAAGRYPDGSIPGLYVQVVIGKDGQPKKSFVLRYKINGRARELGLGAYPSAVSLSAAREKAREARGSISKGIDPLAAKAEAKAAAEAAAKEKAGVRTFEAVAREFVQLLIKKDPTGKFHRVSAKAWTSSLERFVFPKIGQLPVADVEHEHVAKILGPLSMAKGRHAREGKGGHSVAVALRGRIERIIHHASIHGYRDIKIENPAKREFYKDLLGPGPKVQHHLAAPLEEVPAIFAKLKAEGGTVANALMLIMLSGCRLREILDARYEEIEDGVLVIPGRRTKRNKDHLVPMTDLMWKIVQHQSGQRTGPHIFPSLRFPGQPLASVTPAGLLKKLEINSTVHGFRSSLRDWAKKNRVDNDVAELILSHEISQDPTVTAYLRTELLEERRAALEAYGKWLNGETAAGNVVPMPKRRKAAK
jgi:integrase